MNEKQGQLVLVAYLAEQGHVAVIAGVNIFVKLGITNALQHANNNQPRADFAATRKDKNTQGKYLLNGEKYCRQ